jgi:carbamate kinase
MAKVILIALGGNAINSRIAGKQQNISQKLSRILTRKIG